MEENRAAQRFTNSSQPVFFRLLEAFNPDFSRGRVRFPLIASVVVKGVVKKPSSHLIRSVAVEIILTAALFLLLGQACLSAEDLIASSPLSSGVAAISRGGLARLSVTSLAHWLTWAGAAELKGGKWRFPAWKILAISGILALRWWQFGSSRVEAASINVGPLCLWRRRTYA